MSPFGCADPSGERLQRLFFPRRIAIAGLSERPRTWGRMAYQYLRQAGFDGEVVAYRPRHVDAEVPAVDDLASGGPVDLVLVAVPAAAAVDVIADSAAAGVGSAVVFSSGFAEEGEAGTLLQQRLVEAAGGMPLLGPNCLGLVSDPASVVVSVSGFLSRPRRSGQVALVSQSGAMGFVLADHLRKRGVGFSFYASTGNEAVLGAADVASYLCARPEVKVVGCYVEGLRDVGAWRSACRRARDLDCHVVALKVGATRAAQRAALSHTASAAGEAEIFEAVCREEGVTLVPDEVAFAEAVCALEHPVRLPHRPGLAVVTMSGGGGAMIADQVSPVADVPQLAAPTVAALRSLGVNLAGDANPVDLTGMFFQHIERLDDVIATVSGDRAVDGVVLYFTFGDNLLEVYRPLGASLPDRAVPAWFVWAGAPDGEVEALASTGRVVANIPDLVRSISAQPRGLPFAEGTVAELRRDARDDFTDLPHGPVITEACLGPLFRRAGLPYVAMVVGTDAASVASSVEQRDLRPPWVAKVDHPGAPHRARLGLLSVGVEDRAHLEAELGRLFAAAAHQGLAGAAVVVEPMLSSVGSFSLGALRHRHYGPIVLVGPGGDQVEEAGMQRVAACLPLSDRGLAALAEGASSLAGRRIDHATLAGAVLALEALLDAQPAVAEVDVNPILVTAAGELVAVDALAVRDLQDYRGRS